MAIKKSTIDIGPTIDHKFFGLRFGLMQPDFQDSYGLNLTGLIYAGNSGGIAVSLGSNIRDGAYGIHAALLGNDIHSGWGAAISGIINDVDNYKGAVASAGVNLINQSLDGLAVSLVGNWSDYLTDSRLRGLLVSGGVNSIENRFDGVMVSPYCEASSKGNYLQLGIFCKRFNSDNKTYRWSIGFGINSDKADQNKTGFSFG